MPLSNALRLLPLFDPSSSIGEGLMQPPSSEQVPDFALSAVLSIRSSGLQGGPSFNATAVLAGQQGHTLAILTTVTSCVSFAATLVAIYWFFMMRRNFRRTLVALLIVADLVKSLCLLVQSATTISAGALNTDSAFCQVTGYVFLTSSESCDITIFLMSLHMVLQIFPSPRLATLGHDGLYHIRGWIYAAWFILPNIMGALAFVNSGQGYAAVGPICALPVRPFWYRLALSWIPRYLMVMYIFYVALRIYKHVGKEFKVFGQVDDESNSVDMPGESSCVRADADAAMTMQTLDTMTDDEKISPLEAAQVRTAPRSLSVPMLQPAPRSKQQQAVVSMSSDYSKLAHTGSLPGTRRPSLITWTDFSLAHGLPPTKSLPSSRRGSRQWPVNGIEPTSTTLPLDQSYVHVPLQSLDFTIRRNSANTFASLRSPGHQPDASGTASTIPIPEAHLSAHAHLTNAQKTALDLIQSRRRAIQRQLRILFIYPVVYILLWIFPFVAHCLNYSNYFAQHPVFAISILNFFCQSFLGCADVLVFSWREKPWRHIPGSDGTFMGSFLFWKLYHAQMQTEQVQPTTPTPPPDATSSASRPDSRTTHSRTGLITSVKHWSMNLASSPPPLTSAPTSPRTAKPPPSIFTRSAHNRTIASDRGQLERERVQERLAMERLHHERAAQDRNGSLNSPSLAGPGERKEWWDGRAYGGRDLFHDDSDDDEHDESGRSRHSNNDNHHHSNNNDDYDDDDDDDKGKNGRESARTEESSSRAASGWTDEGSKSDRPIPPTNGDGHVDEEKGKG